MSIVPRGRNVWTAAAATAVRLETYTIPSGLSTRRASASACVKLGDRTRGSDFVLVLATQADQLEVVALGRGLLRA